MQPIPEYGSDERKKRLYDVEGANPDRAKKNGNTAPGDGVLYAGRGFVQLTWKNNYQRLGQPLKLQRPRCCFAALCRSTASLRQRASTMPAANCRYYLRRPF